LRLSKSEHLMWMIVARGEKHSYNVCISM
jgi:hypothetical protein